MRFLLVILVLTLSIRPGLARDLPQGEYLLMGDVFPAMRKQIMVPVFAHLKTDGDRLEWTFFTAYVPNEEDCDRIGKCNLFVRSLSHRVDWDADGTLRILETDREMDDKLTIDRPDIDGPHIYGAIEALLDGATLRLGHDGGTLTNRGRRGPAGQVDLLPATLDQATFAMALSQSFSLSLFQLEGCAIRQVLAIANDPTPTSAERMVLDAMTFSEEMRRLKSLAFYYRTPPEGTEQAVERARQRLELYRYAIAWPAKDTGEALIAGTPLTDDAVMALVAEAAEAARRPDDPYGDSLAKDLLTVRRGQLLAYIRFSSRYAAMVHRGADPVQAICADVTLEG